MLNSIRLLMLSCLALTYAASELCNVPACASDYKLLAVPWHSGQYIICRDQQGFLRECPPSSYFDETSERCLPGTATLKSCVENRTLNILSNMASRLDGLKHKDITVDEVIENIVHSLKKESDNVKTYNEKSYRAGNISQQCRNHSVTPVVCPEIESADGLLPHPDDCQLFYYCVSPTLPPVCRDCPAGLHFNPVKHVCDNPEEAGCAAKPPGNNNNTTTDVPTTGKTSPTILN